MRKRERSMKLLGADMITERVDSTADGALREVAYSWPSGRDLA